MTVTTNEKIYCRVCPGHVECRIEETRKEHLCHNHLYLASPTASSARRQAGAGQAPAVATGGLTDAEQAERDIKLNRLSTSGQVAAARLMQESWSGTFGELLEQARAECGPAAAWLRDHPRVGSVPTLPHPRTPEAARGREADRWRAACSAVGPKVLSLTALSGALNGPYDLGALGDFPLNLPYGGVNGARHFHPGCPATVNGHTPVASPGITHTTLARMYDDLPSANQLHSCSEDVDLWLPQDPRAEAALFADAELLTRGWREAQDRSELHGRPIYPERNHLVALTSGLLTDLAATAHKYSTDHPARTHVAELAVELDTVAANWAELEDRRVEVDNDDPHKKTQDWAHEHKLPPLSGSEKQVRWAEKIRYEMCAGDDELTGEIAAVEEDCGVWIGLSKSSSDDLVATWEDMRDRPRHRWGD